MVHGAYSVKLKYLSLKFVAIIKFAVEEVCWIGSYDVDITALSNYNYFEN